MQEIDNLSKFGNSFQSKVVSALLTDGKFLEKLSEILSPKFFESEANKWIVDEIIDYNQGGEYINQTLEETVPFRYGRVIEFETHQLHRGMAFKIPNVARYSLKFVGKEIE